MSIFIASTKSVSRGNGQSAVASASYRAGERLEDKRYGKTHDYSKRYGVMSANIILPSSLEGKDIAISRSELWNLAEESEKRKDARVAREWLINLPHELPEQAREKLAHNFSRELADRYNVIADCAIHQPTQKEIERGADPRNFHAHILLTTRQVALDKNNKITLTDKSTAELSDKKRRELGLDRMSAEVKEVRQLWERVANEMLEEYGLDLIDSRSYKDRGLDIEPQFKMGATATQLERKKYASELKKAKEAEAKGERYEIDRTPATYFGMMNEMVNERNELIFNRQMRESKEREERNGRLRKSIDRATSLTGNATQNTAILDEKASRAERSIDSTERGITSTKQGIARAERVIEQADRAIVEHQRQLEQEQPTNQQPQSIEALKTELSVNEKRRLLKSFHKHIDQEAEKLLKVQLKQIREQAKPQLDKINQLRDSKPFNPFKIKAWQQDIDKRVEQYNKVKAQHDQLKANGVTKEHRTQAMRDYYLERPEAYDTIVDIQKQLKEHDRQQEAQQQQELVRTSSRSNSRGR